MADIESIVPFLLYWETGVKDDKADCKTLFLKARGRGVVADPADTGGATVAGVTLATYRHYRSLKRLPRPGVDDLAAMSYAEWLDVLRTLFWNSWQADRIQSGAVAHMLVDWVWTSGNNGILIPQHLLGVKADGIVGEKTLAAVNSSNPAELFSDLKQARIAFIESICRRRPANLRFRSGWLRRISAIPRHE